MLLIEDGECVGEGEEEREHIFLTLRKINFWSVSEKEFGTRPEKATGSVKAMQAICQKQLNKVNTHTHTHVRQASRMRQKTAVCFCRHSSALPGLAKYGAASGPYYEVFAGAQTHTDISLRERESETETDDHKRLISSTRNEQERGLEIKGK